MPQKDEWYKVGLNYYQVAGAPVDFAGLRMWPCFGPGARRRVAFLRADQLVEPYSEPRSVAARLAGP